MTKQEKIREGIAVIIAKYHKVPFVAAEVKEVLSYLHSQGVVIKVERKLPAIPEELLKKDFISGVDCLMIQQDILRAGCGFFEPLI